MNLFAPSSDPVFKRHAPRREYKYQITTSQIPLIKQAIAHYCQVDPFVAGADRYTITSLYLDTRRRDLYWATEMQRHSRVKVRIRTYGMQSEGPVFLEIKRRFGDTQSKSRVQVPRDQWRLAVEPGGLEDARKWGLETKKWSVVEDFAAQVGGWGLVPVCCVRYDRDPYVGVLNPDIRITFDQAIRTVVSREHGECNIINVPYFTRFPKPRVCSSLASRVDGMKMRAGSAAGPPDLVCNQPKTQNSTNQDSPSWISARTVFQARPQPTESPKSPTPQKTSGIPKA